MKLESLKKLITEPKTTLYLAFRHRLKRWFDLSDSGSLSKANEHLIAVSMLGNTLPRYDHRERVYVLTEIPFWRRRLGNQNRIAEMVAYLEQHFNVQVVYTAPLSIYDAKEICGGGWQKNVVPLKNAENALYFERAYRSESFAKKDAFIGAEQFAILLQNHPAKAVIVQYITHEPYVRYLNSSIIKIIDTHDVMSLREKAFRDNGRDHHIKISEEEEIHWLRKFDKVIAIQDEECEFLAERLGREKVILCYHPVKIENLFKLRRPKRIVYIAGMSPQNLDSINWFINKVWPEFRYRNEIELHIYGGICSGLGDDDRIMLHSNVPDSRDVYIAGDIVINPVLYGGGLKIKTVEAMSYGLPMVTTAEGARGIDLECKAFLVADGPEEFRRHMEVLVEDGNLRKKLSESSLNFAASRFSAGSCFDVLVESIQSADSCGAWNLGEGYVEECDDSFERTLIVGSRDFPFFWGAVSGMKKFRNAIYLSTWEIRNVEDFSRVIKERCIDQVFINNPYISELNLEFYQYAKRQNIPVVTFDRGALPDSWFFDHEGFNGDSSSYFPARWDRKLSDLESENTRKYIDELFSSGMTLEKQGNRVTADKLRRELGVEGKKVLFVPFQRPEDTVVRYFSNGMGMAGFLSFVNNICQPLADSGWVVVGKKHPLEVVQPECNLLMVNADVHINDLLEMCDAVLTINSGVGVLALMANKPIFVTGAAFYAAEGLAEFVSDEASFLSQIGSLNGPSREKVLRFVRYLIEDFYSFGKSSGYLRKELSGELSAITTEINFYKIRNIVPSSGRDYGLC